MLRHLRMTSILVLLQFFSLSSFGSTPEFYTVRESVPVSDISLDPAIAFAAMTNQVVDDVLDLLSWQLHMQKMPEPTEPYNRLSQYGTWVLNPQDGTCHNTRARVLMRESQVPVTFSRGGCSVIAGKWLDPYSNRYYERASDLDIDHVVPLKNSYTSGAWSWDYKKRCLYANFMENEFHLIPVKDDDNKKKGDSGPDKFMPSDRAYACEYLANWLKIKLIWNLAMPSAEAEAIEKLSQSNHCANNLMSLEMSDLRRERQSIFSNIELCK